MTPLQGFIAGMIVIGCGLIWYIITPFTDYEE